MKQLLTFFIFAILITSPAWAEVKTLNNPTAPEPVSVITRKIESYMRGVDTMKSRFVQTAPDGTQRIGTFYLDRPGRMRFDYDAPVRDLVVADGVQLFYYDGELKQTASAPVGQTLADFILRKNIKLSGDIKIMRVQEGAGLMQVTLTQIADPDAGTMTLGFTQNPFSLKKWRITDGTGQITEVELFDVQENIAVPAALFVYRDPNHPKGNYN
jgi:outer membrane lipoprotein-sorting protein